MSWAMLGAFQQDTSNKQRLKKQSCSPSQGFSSEMPQLQLPLCLWLSPKLASVSSPVLLTSKGDPGLGNPCHGRGVPPLSQPCLWCGEEWPWVPRAFIPGRRAEEAEPSCHTPPPASTSSPSFQEQKSKEGEQHCRAIKNKNESPLMN